MSSVGWDFGTSIGGVGGLEDPRDEALVEHWQGEVEACRLEPAYLVDRYGWIDRPASGAAGVDGDRDLLEPGQAGSPGEPVRFRLWPDQVELLGTLMEERRIVILKARQLGISWVVCAYVLWLCLFRRGQAILLYSKGQREADELVRRIRLLYERLPGSLREFLARPVGKPSKKEVVWSNGNRILSMPSTTAAGISFTASLVVMDEAAYCERASELYAAVSPTMEHAGQMVLLSVANGLGGLFCDVWEQATVGMNDFYPIFMPWWSRPGRDVAWYERQRRQSNDPEKFLQNYPATAAEAFRSTGFPRFPTEWIRRQMRHLREPLPDLRLPGELQGMAGLLVWEVPRAGVAAGIFADTAEGREDGAADAATVIELRTRRQLAELHGHWEPDDYAGLLDRLGRAYDRPLGRSVGALYESIGAATAEVVAGAPLLVERNNHGHTVLLGLRNRGYGRLLCGPDGRPGWVTMPRGEWAKSVMIDTLAEGLRDDTLAVRSRATLGEMARYQRRGNGTTGAPAGRFDDRVMSWALGCAWLRREEVERARRARRGRATVRRNPLAGYRG